MILILAYTQMFALDKESTLKIYTKILSSIFPTKKQINVYVPNREYYDILKSSNKLNVVDDIKKASIAIVTNLKELQSVKKLNKDIEIFATNEKLLFQDQSIVGAFYWKKGRSQLLFIKNRLDRYHIKLSDEYDKFIIEL
jgi:hypothetical protein